MRPPVARFTTFGGIATSPGGVKLLNELAASRWVTFGSRISINERVSRNAVAGTTSDADRGLVREWVRDAAAAIPRTKAVALKYPNFAGKSTLPRRVAGPVSPSCASTN